MVLLGNTSWGSWWCYWVTHLGGVYNSTITIDWEISMLKFFMLLNFRGFVQSANFFMVDVYNMDEHLKSFYRLVYYWVSGEWGIAGCSSRSDIYPGECGFVRTSFHWSLPCKFNFCVLKFHGWSRPRNYFNSEIFPIYGMVFIMPADVSILSSLY